MKSLIVGEGYTENIIYESPIILKPSDLDSLSLPQKILKLNENYSLANFETAKREIMLAHNYDDESFKHLADLFIGDKKHPTIRDFRSHLDLSPRSFSATTSEVLQSESNVYFAPATPEAGSSGPKAIKLVTSTGSIRSDSVPSSRAVSPLLPPVEISSNRSDIIAPRPTKSAPRFLNEVQNKYEGIVEPITKVEPAPITRSAEGKRVT